MAQVRKWLANLGLIVSNDEALAIQADIAPYIATLQSYPSEVLQTIAMNLPYRSIIALCLASRDFQYKICDDQDFWHTLYRRDLSENTRGITNFQKAYHTSTLPSLIGNQPNKRAWTSKGYVVITTHPDFYNLETKSMRLSMYRNYIWDILQSLDHYWDKRSTQLIDAVLTEYKTIPGVTYEGMKNVVMSACVIFIVGKGDIKLLQSFIDRYGVQLEALRSLGYLIAGTDSLDMAEYLFGLSSPGDLEDIRRDALYFGSLKTVQYVLKKNPPTQLTRSTILKFAKYNTHPDVRSFFRSPITIM